MTPNDAPNALAAVAKMPQRVVVFGQNPYPRAESATGIAMFDNTFHDWKDGRFGKVTSICIAPADGDLAAAEKLIRDSLLRELKPEQGGFVFDDVKERIALLRVAQAGDYVFQKTMLLGTERTGPDLSQEGGVHPDDWHRAQSRLQCRQQRYYLRPHHRHAWWFQRRRSAHSLDSRRAPGVVEIQPPTGSQLV